MMPIENIQEFRSVCAWIFFFAHSLHAGLQSGRTKEPLAGTRTFYEGILYDPGVWQSSEAAGLS